jgi:hypothetical protein
MTTGALILFEVFIGLVIVFGIYAGLHRKDDSEEKTNKIDNRNT